MQRESAISWDARGLSSLQDQSIISWEMSRGQVTWDSVQRIFKDGRWHELQPDEWANDSTFKNIFNWEWARLQKEEEDLRQLKFRDHWTHQVASTDDLRNEWAREWFRSRKYGYPVPLLLHAAPEEAITPAVFGMLVRERRPAHLREWIDEEIGERASSWQYFMQSCDKKAVSFALMHMAREYKTCPATDVETSLGYARSVLRGPDNFFQTTDPVDYKLMSETFIALSEAGLFQEASTEDLARAGAGPLGRFLFSCWGTNAGQDLQEAISRSTNPLETVRSFFRGEQKEELLSRIQIPGSLDSWMNVTSEDARDRLEEVFCRAAEDMLLDKTKGFCQPLVNHLAALSPSRAARWSSRY